MKFVNFLVLLLFFTSTACKNKDKAEAAEFFKRANYNFGKNETDKALTFYNEAIEKVPDFADAYFNRGILFEKRGEMSLAIKDYRKAVDLDDSFKAAKLNLAAALSQINELPEAQEIFQNLEDSYKDSLEFNSLYGQHLIRQNKLDEARKFLNISKDLDSTHAEVWTNLGYIEYLEKNWDAAHGDFENALKIEPDFAFSLNNLSNVYAQKNDWSKALEYSTKAINIDKNNLIFLNTHSLNLLENNKLNEAEELILRCSKLEENNPYFLRNNAVFYLKNGEFNKAESILLNLDKSNPDVDFLYYYMGTTYRGLNNTEKACQFFKRGALLHDLRSEVLLKRC